MKFSDFLSESFTKNELNEARLAKYKPGSFVYYDKYETGRVGLVVVGKMKDGYVAVRVNDGYDPSIVNSFKSSDISKSVWLDRYGNVSGDKLYGTFEYAQSKNVSDFYNFLTNAEDLYDEE